MVVAEPLPSPLSPAASSPTTLPSSSSSSSAAASSSSSSKKINQHNNNNQPTPTSLIVVGVCSWCGATCEHIQMDSGLLRRAFRCESCGNRTLQCSSFLLFNPQCNGMARGFVSGDDRQCFKCRNLPLPSPSSSSSSSSFETSSPVENSENNSNNNSIPRNNNNNKAHKIIFNESVDKKAWCSACLEFTVHFLSQGGSMKFFGSEATYECNSCHRRTKLCSNCPEAMVDGEGMSLSLLSNQTDKLSSSSSSSSSSRCLKCKGIIKVWEDSEFNRKLMVRGGDCSWCFSFTEHRLEEQNSFRRSVYCCLDCLARTLPCMKCKTGMTRGGMSWDDKLCVSCSAPLSLASRPLDSSTLHCRRQAMEEAGWQVRNIRTQLQRSGATRDKARAEGVERAFLLLVSMSAKMRSQVAGVLGISILHEESWGDAHEEAWVILNRNGIGLQARANELKETLNPMAKNANWYEIMRRSDIGRVGRTLPRITQNETRVEPPLNDIELDVMDRLHLHQRERLNPKQKECINVVLETPLFLEMRGMLSACGLKGDGAQSYILESLALMLLSKSAELRPELAEAGVTETTTTATTETEKAEEEAGGSSVGAAATATATATDVAKPEGETGGSSSVATAAAADTTSPDVSPSPQVSGVSDGPYSDLDQQQEPGQEGGTEKESAPPTPNPSSPPPLSSLALAAQAEAARWSMEDVLLIVQKWLEGGDRRERSLVETAIARRQGVRDGAIAGIVAGTIVGGPFFLAGAAWLGADAVRAYFGSSATHVAPVVGQILTQRALLALKGIDINSYVSTSSAASSRSSLRAVMRDGRWLSYAEWGAADGTPIFFFHSLLASRFEKHPDDIILDRLKIRLITVDRPGYGRSDPMPTRTYEDFAKDVADLADSLQIPTFGVVGFSSGGPYAYACCRYLPGRVAACAVISSDVPYTEVAIGELSDANKALWYLSRTKATTKLMLKPVFWALYQSCHTNPESYLREVMSEDASDYAVAAVGRMGQMIVNATREGCVQGVDGAVEDVLLERRPWGFSLSDVRIVRGDGDNNNNNSSPPVRIWHGGDDSQLRLNIPRYAEKMLPHSSMHVVDGEAHHSVFLVCWEMILRQVVKDMEQQ